MHEIQEFLETLSIPSLLKIIFHPIVEFQNELDAIFSNKYTIRSAFRIASIILAGIFGIFFFYYNNATHQFFANFTEIINIPANFQPATSAALSILTFSDVGAYLSNVIVRSICKCLFGDPDFYITNSRAISLAKQFTEQGHCNVDEESIREVIGFCIKNYRKQSSTELGAKPEDWKKTIESLLYDADLEHFLDQQQVLKIKQQEIQQKRAAILAFATTYAAVPPNQNVTPPTTTLTIKPKDKRRQQRDSTDSTASNQLTTNRATSTSLTDKSESTESTHLLTSPTSGLYSSFSQSVEITTVTEESIRQDLNNFRHRHSKKGKHSANQPSDAQILHHYNCHLQHRELTTDEGIFPVHLAQTLSFRASQNLFSQSSVSAQNESSFDALAVTFGELSTSEEDASTQQPPELTLEQPTPAGSRIYSEYYGMNI